MKDLKDIAEKNPFKVPEKYFEELNKKIIASTAEKVNEPKHEGIYRRLKPFLAVAASVALLILLSYTALKIFKPSDITGKIPEISLQEFSDTYLNEIDILTLEEGIPAVASYDGVRDVSNAEIIDYLIVENIDLNDIYEIL